MPEISETERRNDDSESIDCLSAIEIVRLMNAEDAGIAAAVGREAQQIAQTIDVIADRAGNGGRLIYFGAGTSGRLGVLDASECPPTFSTPPAMVLGLIAGGSPALTRAIEGAEDHPEAAVADLRRVNLSQNDVAVGIATSGRTPYVIGGLKYAREVKAYTVGLACTPNSALVAEADLMITPIVGAEVVTGSTRLKAGTATKMVLNMLTTGTMVRLGKTFGNLMVDLTATNLKLEDRSCRIVSEVTGIDAEQARQAIRRCDGELKTAIVATILGLSPTDARRCLQSAGGHLRTAIRSAEPTP
jgi:N-acetylmuramic acid 6-phosphate etherase